MNTLTPIDATIHSGLLELGIGQDLTPEELFDYGVNSLNRAICFSIKAGMAFWAASEALKIQESAMADSKTFLSWITERNLTKRRVYECISIAKAYLALPASQRKTYLNLGQFKARKLASLDPETLSEIAEQHPNLLDEMATMSRTELKETIKKLKVKNANLEATLESRSLLIERLLNGSRITEFESHTEAVRRECLALQAEVELPLNALKKLFNDTIDDPCPSEEHPLCLEQVVMTAMVIAARVTDFMEYLKDRCDPSEFPERITSIHIMTPEEAKRWITDYKTIVNKHESAKLLRQEKLDESKPRRGRPRKS